MTEYQVVDLGGEPVTQTTPVVAGPVGKGVPSGGGDGQVLAKASGGDYDTEWVNQTGGGGAVSSVNSRTGAVVVTATDVGLGNVTNTADSAKPVSTAQQTALDGKAALSHTHAQSDITGLAASLTAKADASATTAALATKADASTTTAALATKADATATTAALAAKADASAVTASLAAKADLVAGVVPTSQIPAIALVTGQVVANRAALLALTNVQEGDIGVISGTTDKGSYILTTPNPAVFANWLLLSSPTDVVTTVNGQTGTVVLGKTDVGLGSVDNIASATLLARANHTGTQSADTLTDGTTNKAFLATERTKLTGVATGATANSADATLLSRTNHTGTQTADTVTDGTTNKAFLATERTKLTGIATSATANSADATLLARANHTGTQAVTTITATGIPSSTTYLRGDGTWSTPAGGSSSTDYIANPAVKSVAWANPQWSSTSLDMSGLPQFSVVGSASAAIFGGSSIYDSAKRLLYRVTTPSTSAVAGWYSTDGGLLRGSVAGMGGFRSVTRFGPDTGALITSRMFVGLRTAGTAPTDVNPSSQTNVIGVGYDANDTQLYVMHNDAAGTCTKIATGLTRSTTNASRAYQLDIQTAAYSGGVQPINVTVYDQVAGTSFSTVLSTDLSTTGIFFPFGYVSVGGVSSAIGIGFMGHYNESST